MLKLAFSFVCCIAVCTASSKIDPSLKTTLKSAGTANIFVSFNDGTQSVLDSFPEQSFETRANRLTALTLALKEHAAATQRNVLELLEEAETEVTSFWINNQVYVRNADLSLVEQLAEFPEVAEVAEEEFFDIDVPVPSEEDDGNAPRVAGNEWGVQKVEAPQAWVTGFEGQGVIVATIDTGVLLEHQDLKHNFVGDYGWYDPGKGTSSPNDQNGHGTHTTGTICGKDGIGVAPGAKWMACKGCATSSCSQHDLISCGQFITCPTKADGSAPDCSRAPRLVSNSWGGGQNRPMYHAVIHAWQKAGIVALFSNGNSGPTCGSANSPADHPYVIGVGSTTSADALSSFSSVGPTLNTTMKPDISAPGSSVRSAYNSGPTGYATLSGTSMACPHVAGVAAILLSQNPKLTPADVKHYLSAGADQATLALTGKKCGGIAEDVFPNHAYGIGRVNANKALNALINSNLNH